jgi:DNA replication and repair protein RecF
MRITRVAAESLRRFEQFRFDPHPGINILHGANAAGKTSVLEAVYLASRASSFRARRLEELIREGQTLARVQVALAEDGPGLVPPTSWSVAVQRGEVQVRRFAEVSSRKELAEAAPVALVDRQLHRVFEEGPVYRRRYLDWGLFYVEQSFFPLWRRYERALRQRNQALRQRLSPGQIAAWDPELVSAGEALQDLRREHLAVLEKEVQLWLGRLLGTDRIALQLAAGWDESLGLQSAISQGLSGDRKMGFTHAGPHRAELKLRFEQRDARSFVSRGQQKLLAVAMILAQASLVARARESSPVILLDDLEAELSQEWQKRLLATLAQYAGQSMVTSLEWRVGLMPVGNASTAYRVFHVEHGNLRVASST